MWRMNEVIMARVTSQDVTPGRGPGLPPPSTCCFDLGMTLSLSRESALAGNL